MKDKYSVSQRFRSRVALVQALYSYNSTKHAPKDVYELFLTFISEYPDEDSKAVSLDLKYFTDILFFAIDNINTIDAEITKSSSRKPSQISNLELAMLRSACAELMLRRDIDGKIIIDQTVSLTRVFANEASHGFINSNACRMCMSIRGTLGKDDKGVNNTNKNDDDEVATTSKTSQVREQDNSNRSLSDFF